MIKEFKYDSAIIFLSQTYEIRKKTGPPEAEAKAARLLSAAYDSKGKTHQSLKILLACLSRMEDAGNIREQAETRLRIANSYEQVGNYATSLRYLHQAEKQLHEAGLDSVSANVAANLANNYYHIDSLKLAEYYYTRALALFGRANAQEKAGLILGYLGSLQHAMGKTGQGYTNLQKALKMAEDQKDLESQASHLNNLAIVHWDQKEWQLAEQKFKLALDKAKQTRNIEMQQDVAGNLYYMFKDQLKYKDALEHLELYMRHHDTLYSETRTKQIAKLQEEYEAERRSREIELLRKDQQLKEANLVKSNWQRNASLAGVFLFALVALLIVRNSRQKQKATAQLTAKNEELNRKRIQELLREQELVSVHSMLKGQEAERGRIAQDLHDRLGSLLATVKLHVQMAKTPEQQKLVNKLIDDACQEVRQIAHNMVSGVLMKFGLVAALQDLAHAISLSGKIKMMAYTYGLDNRLPNHMEIELYRIVQELVSNALKHAQASEITVQINRQGNILNLLVEDNGVGFNPQHITGKTGMGLGGISARVKQLNGELNIDSGKGSGTTIMADFPLPAFAEFKPQTAPAGDFAL